MATEAQRRAIRKYHKDNFRLVSTRIRKEMFDEFERKCEEEGIAKAAVLRAAIELFIEDDEE